MGPGKAGGGALEGCWMGQGDEYETKHAAAHLAIVQDCGYVNKNKEI